MANECWNVRFHLRSPRAWLNDPNGLVYFQGRYHVFYQYNSQWPDRSQKAWGHFASPDLITWDYLGMPLEPTCQEDAYGCYSGCAVEDEEGRLRIFYTGNTVDETSPAIPQDVSHALSGRWQYQLACTSKDGVSFEDKHVIIAPDAYPSFCSRHVRDPFVWREGGTWHMLLGARNNQGRGLCLLFESKDTETWTYAHAIESDYPFGYMWECPNLIRLCGKDYLAFCPEGLPRLATSWQNLSQAGYVPLERNVLETTFLDERGFREWDCGHDFYAPQVMCDESGRTLLIGWLGTFNPRFEAAPQGLAWAHCLSVPRELTAGPDGTICQWPAAELEALREEPLSIATGEPLVVPCRAADVVLEGISGQGHVSFDDDLEVSYEDGRITYRYRKDSACGRDARSMEVGDLEDLRILVDGSVVELYANGGATVASLRWFPEEAAALRIESTFAAGGGLAYPMRDLMSETYEQAVAPDIDFAGFERSRKL